MPRWDRYTHSLASHPVPVDVITLPLRGTFQIPSDESHIMISISEQIARMSNGSTIALTTDVEEAVVIPEGRKLKFDLGGHTWSAPVGETPLTVLGGTADVRNGTIRSVGNAAIRLGQKSEDAASAPVSAAILANDLQVVSEDDVGVFLAAGARLDTSADISAFGEYAAIQGNGSATYWYNSAYITGGTVTAKNMAIYWPQVGDLTISGGTITGGTGVEVRAGTLTISGGTITGTASPSSVTPNGNGSTSDGVGVAIAQHNTEQAISATIRGGTIQGYSAVYQSNPQGNPGSKDQVKLAITNGTFSAINGGTVPVYSEDLTGVVSGGTFNGAVPQELCAEGFAVVQQSDGSYRTSNSEWDYMEGGATGAGFLGLRRFIITASGYQYKEGGIDTANITFEPVALLSATARGGITGWYDPVARRILLYRDGKEAVGQIDGLTLVMIGR